MPTGWSGQRPAERHFASVWASAFGAGIIESQSIHDSFVSDRTEKA